MKTAEPGSAWLVVALTQAEGVALASAAETVILILTEDNIPARCRFVRPLVTALGKLDAALLPAAKSDGDST